MRWRTDYFGRRRHAARSGGAAPRHHRSAGGSDPGRPRRHLLPDILRVRIFANACGYEDADDLDRLWLDPAFKLACGRLPDTGSVLCSQPTISRWENAPSLRDLIRLMGVMVDYCSSYVVPPTSVTLDIDDTVDVVRPSAALAVQRPLRRALLPANPRLRHGDEPAGCCASPPWQNA